jgi:hypothetical protein
VSGRGASSADPFRILQEAANVIARLAASFVEPNMTFHLLVVVWPLIGLHHVAAETPARAQTQVLIVGTFHMGNPGLDLFNPGIKDVLGARRQREILDVVERLKGYRPTKIALESPSGSTAMQQRLDQYLAGHYVLTADERDQIGLRLAKDMKHSRVHGIDFPMDLDFKGLFGYAEKHGQGDLVQSMMGEFESKIKPTLDASYMESHTVREILHDSNAPAIDELGHRIYMSAMRIGKDKDYPGTDLVARWYERNLRIATNIARLREKPDGRILILIGAGHGKLLRQFLAETPGFEVVDCSRYLK